MGPACWKLHFLADAMITLQRIGERTEVKTRTEGTDELDEEVAALTAEQVVEITAMWCVVR